MILLEQIKKDLIDAVDTHAVIDRIASDFYERIEELRATDAIFYQMLWEYETFRAYFKAENETLLSHQEILLKDMSMNLEDEIDDSFDQVEDRKMEELLLPDFRQDIMKDLHEQGITLAPKTRLSSDIIEKLYEEAYRAFDAYKERLYQRVLDLSPMKAYERGKALKEQFRKDRGIRFDEEDFLSLFDDMLKKEHLMDVLKDKVREVLKYNRHYILADVDPEEVVEDTLEPENERLDGVLTPDGDLKDQPYSFVSELMSEYTGRRILATENELSDESYWTTYADDFQDLILSYVEARLEEELRFLQSERAEDWTAFRTLCRLSDEEVKDTERFLLKCDKVNYGLAQRVDDLWQKLCQTPLKEI